MASQHSDHSQTALDLMAQLQDPQWALAAARIEEEARGEISAGPELRARLGQFMAEPHSFHQFQRLRSLVLRAFQRLLTDGNLGVGTDAAWSVGQKRLVQRLKQPSPDIQAQLKLVLAEDLAATENEPLSAAAQTLLQETVYTALTPEDWDDIAAAAAKAVQQQVKQLLKWPQSA
ncbi:MAG: hypothetical protein AAGF98_01640 [Cyanobacteria bacterium P01_H01_bin.153]